jgi:serine/threonine protein kinase
VCASVSARLALPTAPHQLSLITFPGLPLLSLSLSASSQGGLPLSSVLSILVQAVAGLLHLHSLGILHRDLRAANLLLDGLDPLHARVADIGVSRLLPAFSVGLRAADLTAGKVPTVLRGSAALGPMQVCACTRSSRRV